MPMMSNLPRCLAPALAAVALAAGLTGAAPAAAEPTLRGLLDRVITEAERGPWRPRLRGDRDLRDLLGRPESHDDTDLSAARDGMYAREVRGLYLPGHDIERVLRDNFSGHRR